MESYKFEGSSIEDALSKACDELSVSENEIEYKLIEESKGFLGIGSKVVIEVNKVQDTNHTVSITLEEGDPIDKPVLIEEESDKDLFFETAKEFIETTVSKMGIKVSLQVNTVNEELIAFDVIGDDIAILIGKYGATLDALQYLACIAANKKFPCRRRIVIDADGHRAKRTKEIQERALKIADMVVKHGREAVMEPQNAKDRRIVHMVLRNHPGVKTYSEGEGIERHVIISPKDN